MPEALNKIQAKQLIADSFDLAQSTPIDISDPPLETMTIPEQLQFCHMRFEGRIHKLQKDQLLKNLTQVHNRTDELNKLIIGVSSPDENDQQTITVHVGKLKTP